MQHQPTSWSTLSRYLNYTCIFSLILYIIVLAGPKITQDPTNIAVIAEGNATFTCSAVAHRIHWYRQLENGHLLFLNSTTKYSVTTLSSGTLNQTSKLTVISVTLSDAGTYLCQASGGTTTDSSSAILTILGKFIYA